VIPDYNRETPIIIHIWDIGMYVVQITNRVQKKKAWAPPRAKPIQEALEAGVMVNATRTEELALFARVAGRQQPSQ
jgi:hypothetical protein